MKRPYIILSVLLIIIALGLALLPRKDRPAKTDPGMLLSSMAERSRYLSADQVTQRIIENDPALLLIDLRPAGQFRKFNLPGAVNMSPDSLLTGNNIELFSQPGKDKVLFGDADSTAEKAWLLCTKYSLKRVYIMKGGMNEWINTIINQKDISGTPSSADLELADFRKAARRFFLGSDETGDKPGMQKPKKMTVIPVRKKASSGGGC